MDPWLRLIAFLLLTVISVTSAWYRTRASSRCQVGILDFQIKGQAMKLMGHSSGVVGVTLARQARRWSRAKVKWEMSAG